MVRFSFQEKYPVPGVERDFRGLNLEAGRSVVQSRRDGN